ncbi:MAG: hypothetical protein AUK37_05840 [Rhodobacterales bacterium CG2_30_65_12]|nr:MAG: hypothetical protein AUK37_05840 [Rhodobacterales bacterium CG2_30_65_12]
MRGGLRPLFRAGRSGQSFPFGQLLSGVADDPPQVPQVMCSTTGAKPDRLRGKDTLVNIWQTLVFCINVVEAGEMQAMNASSARFPAGTDDFGADCGCNSARHLHP